MTLKEAAPSLKLHVRRLHIREVGAEDDNPHRQVPLRPLNFDSSGQTDLANVALTEVLLLGWILARFSLRSVTVHFPPFQK